MEAGRTSGDQMAMSDVEDVEKVAQTNRTQNDVHCAKSSVQNLLVSL